MDNVTIDTSVLSLTTSEAPTSRLRWLPRLKANSTTEVENVLQQQWNIISYQGVQKADWRSEWRDVPTETEA